MLFLPISQNDGVAQYIDWAVAKNFGVIDINVPHYITHPEASFLSLDRAHRVAGNMLTVVC